MVSADFALVGCHAGNYRTFHNLFRMNQLYWLSHLNKGILSCKRGFESGKLFAGFGEHHFPAAGFAQQKQNDTSAGASLLTLAYRV